MLFLCTVGKHVLVRREGAAGAPLRGPLTGFRNSAVTTTPPVAPPIRRGRITTQASVTCISPGAVNDSGVPIALECLR
jgi:hypothetical protein